MLCRKASDSWVCAANAHINKTLTFENCPPSGQRGLSNKQEKLKTIYNEKFSRPFY